MRVLLVEGDDVLRSALTRDLMQAGFAVDAAADGRRGALLGTGGTEQEENTMKPVGHRIAGLAAAAALIAAAPASAQEWLSLGAKYWAPTVFHKSGTGTANAVAEARVTPQALTAWCENWTPDDKGCPARMMAEVDLKRVYRATASCLAGHITTVQGESYTLAGVWDGSDIGAGRTKWRDASGAVVGRDNASGGLGIAQQWEVLCPGPLKVDGTAATPAAAYAVGDAVEARYGRAWMPARVLAVRPGPSEPQYDVRLANGKRGVVPAAMLRKRPGR